MIEAMLLAVALVWIAISIGAGMLVYRWQRKRWMQVATTLLLIWLPFWDVIPGYYLYRKAVREVGGVRIYRTVQAEGYLDLSATDCDSCWSRLRDYPFRYVEIKRTGPTGVLSTIESGKGFYEYRLAPVEDITCGSFSQLRFADQLQKGNGIQGNCVVAVKRDRPVSRFEYSTSGWEILRDEPLLRPIEKLSQRITDRESGEVIAESYEIRFVNWIGAQLELPGWSYTRLPSGKRITFEIEDVVNPL